MFKTIFSMIVILFFTTACQSTTVKTPKPKGDKVVIAVSCKDPRPKICTQEYMPVCANKDTGVRCITTPCPSSEQVTYPNACSACADDKVYGHIAGACESN